MVQFLRRLPNPNSRSRVWIDWTRRSISSGGHSNSWNEDLSRLLQGRVGRPHLLQIHARVFRLDAHQDNLVATRLIGHYRSVLALRVFKSLRCPNIFPYNAIIRVLAEEGLFWNAASIFKQLKFRAVWPNDLTFSFLLKACSGAGVHVNCVKQIHSDIVKLGFTSDPFVCNGLLMVYAKGVRDLVSAHLLFDEMSERNSVCWTSLISGYAKLGLPGEAFQLFVKMLAEDLEPESDTMVSILAACSWLDLQDIEKWVNLLTNYAKNYNNFGRDYVNIVLVYLYGKCGKIEKSRQAFDQISDVRKQSVVVSWNAMIAAYVRNGCATEAVTVFRSMIRSFHCCPNHVTMVSVLSACAEIGDLELGLWVHEYMRERGHKGVLSSNANLATALIDMYAKCGNLEMAKRAFNELRKKDVVSFNAMIMGLAVNGEGEEALSLFSKMQELGLSPDSGTLLGALCACSHSGMLHKGREIFNKMAENKNVAPGLEHYACYIDLLSRSGFIEDALGIVASMPFKPNNYVWGSLLSGCVLHNQLELSQVISSMLVDVDPENSAGYVMLSNSLAADSQWRDVSKLRGVMREKGLAKQPGCSWINVDGVVREFVAGSASFPGIGSVQHMMESLLKEMKLSSRWRFTGL